MHHQDLHEFVADCVEELRQKGDRLESAACALETKHDILPILIDTYRSEDDLDMRAQLLEIILQRRSIDALDVLLEAVRDRDALIWKTALDGLVTLGGNQALQSLCHERERLRSGSDALTEKVEWIDEAISQIETANKEQREQKDILTRGIRLSTRKRFRESDEGWARYMESMRLEHTDEVRSLDPLLNQPVDDCGDYMLDDPSEIAGCLEHLPQPDPESEYYLLAIKVEQGKKPEPPSGWSLLGHDLCDEFTHSAVLNCGPWVGALASIAKRVNKYGLLSLTDARKAQELLPSAWLARDPHADVDVWALFERRSNAGRPRT